jgi:hypothetical protein
MARIEAPARTPAEADHGVEHCQEPEIGDWPRHAKAGRVACSGRSRTTPRLARPSMSLSLEVEQRSSRPSGLDARATRSRLSPKYVDVAIRRWQDFTAAKATLDGDGRCFDEIAAARAAKAATEESAAAA